MAKEYNIGNVMGPPGKSPYINANGNWDEWDGAQWVDTGVKAQGPTGPIGDVTGQSLFDYSVANGFTGTYDDWLSEYLKRETDLPWCKGYFQNRSFAKGDNALVTPIYEEGDSSLIAGDRFIVPFNGIYLLSVSSATVAATPTTNTLITIVCVNKMTFTNLLTGHGITPEGTVFSRFEAGDQIYITYWFNPAQSGFTGATPNFMFKCIAEL